MHTTGHATKLQFELKYKLRWIEVFVKQHTLKGIPTWLTKDLKVVGL